MRTQHRNRKRFLYSLFESKTPLRDANGHLTGEYAITYGNVMSVYANISATKGQAQMEQFGVSADYSRTIVLPGTEWKIDETTRIWIDIDAETYDEDVSYTAGQYCVYRDDVYCCASPTTGAFNPLKWVKTRNNYEVAAVAVSLNSTTVAVAEKK